MPLLPDGYTSVTLSWGLSGASKQYAVVCAAGDGNNETGAETVTAAAWYDALTASGRPCAAGSMLDSWTFLGVDTLTRDAGTGVMSTAHQGPPVVGTLSSGSPPVEVVPGYTPMCVTKRTALAGRQGRGRMYAPATKFTVANASYDGVLDTGVVGTVQGWWSAFLTDINSDAAQQMVVTHVTPGPTNGQLVTSLFVRPVLASQRRRKVRGA